MSCWWLCRLPGSLHGRYVLPVVLPFTQSLTLLWLYGRSVKVRLLLESIDETSLSGVVAFCGRLCVVAFAGSGGCLLKVSVTKQTLAHDVLLLTSNIAWFLLFTLVKITLGVLTPSFIRLNSFQWSVGSLLNVSVSTSTLAHGVLFPLFNVLWFLGGLNEYVCGNYVGSVWRSSVFAMTMPAAGLTSSSIWWTSVPNITSVFGKL